MGAFEPVQVRPAFPIPRFAKISVNSVMAEKRACPFHVGRRVEARLGLGAMMIVIATLAAPTAGAQTSTPALTFEAASIKPAAGCDEPGRGPRSQGVTPGRMNLECTTLEGLIRDAYWIFQDPSKPDNRLLQIEGGPGWLRSERYSITATAPDGNETRGQMLGPMLKMLLQERFALKLHRETREGPVYNLT